MRHIKLNDYSDGNYPNVIESDFLEYKSYLPIITQDYQYVMDIMFISGFGVEMERSSRSGKRKTNGILGHVKDIYNEGAPDYNATLVIVETTSRKAWIYSMHGKDEGEDFQKFKEFLGEINNRISKLLSDMGREYDVVKRYIDTLKIPIEEEDGSMRYIPQIHYYQEMPHRDIIRFYHVR